MGNALLASAAVARHTFLEVNRPRGGSVKKRTLGSEVTSRLGGVLLYPTRNRRVTESPTLIDAWSVGCFVTGSTYVTPLIAAMNTRFSTWLDIWVDTQSHRPI